MSLFQGIFKNIFPWIRIIGGSIKNTQIKIPIVVASSTGNVAASTMDGGAEKITGAYVRTLPTLVAGMNALFRASTAAVFSVKAGASCHFEMFDGTVISNGDKITSGGTKNEFLHIICETANVGIVIGQNGAMTDGGP